jgi:hypothetical protein
MVKSITDTFFIGRATGVRGEKYRSDFNHVLRRTQKQDNMSE